jgi:hypothetical protein
MIKITYEFATEADMQEHLHRLKKARAFEFVCEELRKRLLHTDSTVVRDVLRWAIETAHRPLYDHDCGKQFLLKRWLDNVDAERGGR